MIFPECLLKLTLKHLILCLKYGLLLWLWRRGINLGRLKFTEISFVLVLLLILLLLMRESIRCNDLSGTDFWGGTEVSHHGLLQLLSVSLAQLVRVYFEVLSLTFIRVNQWLVGFGVRWLLEMWSKREWVGWWNSLTFEPIYWRCLLSTHYLEYLLPYDSLQCGFVDHLIILIISMELVARNLKWWWSTSFLISLYIILACNHFLGSKFERWLFLEDIIRVIHIFFVLFQDFWSFITLQVVYLVSIINFDEIFGGIISLFRLALHS